ncbi:Conserved_hypothetical protein [Hexamita inflata]|uniref:Myb-like domain-containing protein n=1 Tax=Hexamita inflata TaxID=28002 RepID=A0AA86Q7F5_9EUKA|nr:Conserved hypothetical protein [Hexamita inflata]
MQEQNKKFRKWTHDEKLLIYSLEKQYGKDFEKYLPHFPNRTLSQIKSFYYNQVYGKSRVIKREAIQQMDPIVQHKHANNYNDNSNIFEDLLSD